MNLECIVCKTETRKYKCPKCIEYYCSLECYKIHKENQCTPKIQQNTDADADNKLNAESCNRTLAPFKTEDTVDPEKLKQLRYSEGLKNCLHNPHLRNLLKEIDKAPNAWKAMKAVMQEPLFIEFADECLKILEPMEENGG